MIKDINDIFEQADKFSMSELLSRYIDEYRDIKSETVRMLMIYYENQGYTITGSKNE